MSGCPASIRLMTYVIDMIFIIRLAFLDGI